MYDPPPPWGGGVGQGTIKTQLTTSTCRRQQGNSLSVQMQVNLHCLNIAWIQYEYYSAFIPKKLLLPCLLSFVYRPVFASALWQRHKHKIQRSMQHSWIMSMSKGLTHPVAIFNLTTNWVGKFSPQLVLTSKMAARWIHPIREGSGEM